jgi:hypothetical protein
VIGEIAALTREAHGREPRIIGASAQPAATIVIDTATDHGERIRSVLLIRAFTGTTTD